MAKNNPTKLLVWILTGAMVAGIFITGIRVSFMFKRMKTLDTIARMAEVVSSATSFQSTAISNYVVQEMKRAYPDTQFINDRIVDEWHYPILIDAEQGESTNHIKFSASRSISRRYRFWKSSMTNDPPAQ